MVKPMKLIIPLIFFLIICAGVGSAVTIPSDVRINLTDINLTIDNLEFDSVTVSDDSVRLDNGYEGVIITMSSTGQANVTLYDAGKEKITASSDNHNTLMQFYVWGYPKNSNIRIDRDGTEYAGAKTNNIGAFTWLYTGGFSTRTFTISVNDFEGAGGVGADTWGSGIAMLEVTLLIMAIGVIIGGLKGQISIDVAIKFTLGLMAVMIIVYMGAGVGSMLDDVF